MTVENDGSFSRKVGLLISYYITLSFWSAQTLALSMVSRNIAGQTKKSTAIACNFVSWAAGNAIGECTIIQTCDMLTQKRPAGIPRLGRTNIPYCVRRTSRLLLPHDADCDLPALLPPATE